MSDRPIRVCSTDGVQPGKPSKFEIDGVGTLAVYAVDGNYFVTDDYCTHSTASLADDGELDGFVIECTWHGGKFDIRTGEVLALPCSEKLRTYETIVNGSDIYIQLPKAGE